MTNAPVIKIKDFGVSTAVFEWANQDGKKSYSIALQRSYKKKDSQDYTEETINMYPEDLLKFAALLTRTYNELVDYRNANRQSAPAATQAVQQSSSVADDSIPF